MADPTPLVANHPNLAPPSPVRLADHSAGPRMILLSGMAIVIGAISSGVAYLLLWLINVITNLAFYQRWSAEEVTPQGHHLGWWVVAVPVTGALIIGLMARFGSEKIRGHGIPEALESILLGRSLIHWKVALLKPISAAISIGSGGPFGAEGPIIMTGGAFGSLFAQRFHLSAAERKTLLVAGAAAGMAAIFATPVAAVLLAVELLLFEWKPRSFIPVTVAASVAAVLRVTLLGEGPIFPVEAHQSVTGAVVACAALVGVLTGFGSGLVTTIVYGMEDAFRKLPVHWMWWPAIGAVVVGIGGVWDPRVLGVGYETIHSLLRGEVVGVAVVGLLVIKTLVWSTALGSGTSGGVLAPLLTIGCSLGAAMSVWLPAGDASTWALIGMAAMMSGSMRAPLTAMVFAIELTHDFNLLPALMMACAASFGVVVLIIRRSILTEKLARRGQHITCEYSIDPFEFVLVRQVMDEEVPTVPAATTLEEYCQRIGDNDDLLAKRQAAFLSDEEGRLVGIITRGDVVRAMQEEDSHSLTLASVGSTQLIVSYPDEPLNIALAKMLQHDIGRLPVVDPTRSSQVVGYLGRAAILSARLRLHQEESVRKKG
ncbi:MAG: chloride channel protein [Verrucomicrobiales bacterium]|jgi:CIC family chloride channel protein|nr:chloride channel protein [Verrucomicrobiales bacterium]HQZ28201.1 chloride channel protein [Verrucomicrobiales bacterium]